MEDTANIKATPRAVELAQEHGVNLEEVTGTGQEGQITADDVKSAANVGEGGSKAVMLSREFGVGEYVAADGTRYASGVTYEMSASEMAEHKAAGVPFEEVNNG